MMQYIAFTIYRDIKRSSLHHTIPFPASYLHQEGADIWEGQMQKKQAPPPSATVQCLAHTGRPQTWDASPPWEYMDCCW